MNTTYDSQGQEVHEGSMLVSSSTVGAATVRVFKISSTHVTIKDSSTFETTLLTIEEFKKSDWRRADQ
ncbi:MAG: hypothetical protein GY721_08320 [Deltaproteobacteria bacterium]|nr:hypothetical protein [Deltaproteobacteria bacterium]